MSKTERSSDAIETLKSLIGDNEKLKIGNRGRYFPMTAIYNEGWLLRLALEKGLIQRALHCNNSEIWFSEAELKSPFLHGEKRENRTHADAVIGSFRIEENTATGVEIDKNNFSTFYTIEAKMFAPLSKRTSNSENEYNQATRYIGCLAQMAFDANLSNDEFKSLGLVVIAPKSRKEKIEKDLNLCKIKVQLDSRIKNYEKQFNSQVIVNSKKGKKNWQDEYRDWSKWWSANHEMFLKNIKIMPLCWEDIVDTDKLLAFYNNCLVYNDSKSYKSK